MLRNGPRSFTPLYSAPDNGASSGGGGGGDGSSSSSSDGSGESGDQGSSSQANVSSHLDPDAWISRHGNAQRALGKMSQKLEQVESDNADYREKLRQQEKQIPEDGSVVVSPDTVERLNEEGYLDTDTPSAEDLVNALEQEREARTSLENRQTFLEVCQLTGANKAALEDLDADTLPYTIKEVEGEDGSVKKAFVQTDDGETPFAEYIKNEYPSFAQFILDGGDQGETAGGGSTPSIPNQPSGSGSSSSSSGAGTSVDDYLQKENERRGRA